MTFSIPSLQQTVQRARNAFRAELPGTDAWLWPNNIGVSAKVFGGLVWQLFGKLAFIDKQRFAYSATASGLTQHGIEYGILQKAASYAGGNIDVPVNFPYTVPRGTAFVRSDGVIYTSTKDVAAVPYSNSSTVSVPVTCNTVGKIGNAVAGTPLATTLVGLADNATTVNVDDDGIGAGADQETTEEYRARILARKRQPPMGGATYDYVAWAKEIPGVTRVFVGKNAFGRGTVGVWFLMDDTYVNGIPQPSDVANVQAYLNAVAPVTADVFVFAPVPDCIDITITGLAPNTEPVQQSAALEIQSMFSRMTQPGMPGAPFVLYQSWIWQAVSNATGAQHHKISVPSDDVTFGTGILPCLRSVKFLPAPKT